MTFGYEALQGDLGLVLLDPLNPPDLPGIACHCRG